MAEAGTFADRVKQQADIVRVVGEYVQLKKAGQNFRGLCPFHSEKTPSFNVHPTRQIYHCFGCGKGGDVFSFVMEMEKCEFPDAVRVVAEKTGIAVPRAKERSPQERKQNQARSALVEMHREAQTFFVQQLETTAEGKLARAYLEDRGLDNAAIERFGIGYAPSGGDALLRLLKQKYAEKLLGDSGLVSRSEQGDRMFDRFRRRITFPIANESGKIVAFGARALGEDQPKYLNSSESPIYSKSNVLYNLNQAREALREVRYEGRYIVLVEGYVDCIQVHSIGIPAVASCGTSLTEAHSKLLKRFTPSVVVWYDADSAGRAGTERSLDILLAQELDVTVYDYHLPSSGSDPDTYIRDVGTDESRAPMRRFDHLVKVLQAKEQEEKLKKQLAKDLEKEPYFLERLNKEADVRRQIEEMKSQIPKIQNVGLAPYAEFLVNRAKRIFDLSTAEGKVSALNSLMPHLQHILNPLARSEWATRIAEQLRIEEPVLRAAFKKAASERRSEVKTQPELVGRAAKPVERRLIRMLAEGEGFRSELAQQLQQGQLYHGLETEKIFTALIVASLSGEPVQPSEFAASLEERDRKTFYEILFEDSSEPTWEEAQSCLEALRHRQAEKELADVQRSIEASPAGPELRGLLERKQTLMRRLAAAR